jgi:hypothetical protein
MTKTWKDYEGPNLGKRHIQKFSQYVTAGSLEALRNSCECCAEEIEVRKKWADDENLKAAYAAADKTAPTSIPELMQDLAGAEDAPVRQFSTGANRDSDLGKLDYEAFLSPLVLRAYATFMDFNRSLADGSVRAGDNWQKGMPLDVYVKSAWRHFFAFWSIHRGWGAVNETIVWAICGVIFNLSGYLHELLKDDPELIDYALAKETGWRDAARAVKAASAPGSSPRS